MAYRLANALVKLRNQVNAAAPARSTASDGWIGDASHFATGASSDHNPWITFNGMGIVTALDITHDPANGCDVWEIAQAIAASRDRRLKYLIYTGGVGGKPGILSQTVSPWVWRERSSDDHPHHLHVSVNTSSGDFDSTSPWSITRNTQPTSQTLEQIMADLVLTNPATKADATAASGLSSIWAYTFLNYKMLTALGKAAGVDVDEAAIAASVVAGLSGPLKDAVTAAVTAGGSIDQITETVVARLTTAIQGA